MRKSDIHPNQTPRNFETEILNRKLKHVFKSFNKFTFIHEKMDFHWGAKAEILELIRQRRKSPETLRLVERRLEFSRQGTMCRKFDLKARRQIWVPSVSRKRNREEIAGRHGEQLERANKFGGVHHPLEERA